MKDIAVEGAIQARNTAPVAIPLLGEYMGWFTLDNTIKLMGGLYLVLQISYLVWRWRKEARNASERSC